MAQASLAQRLGHGADSRLLIVTCDDLGSSASANRATMAALDHGVATAASLMVPCPAAHDAALAALGRPIGIHLTLTSEYPRHRWRSLTRGRSLEDADGYCHAGRDAAVARIDPEQARAECHAQIETALHWGLDVTHIDTHMDVLLGRDDLCALYLELAETYRLPLRLYSEGERSQRARAAAQTRDLLCADRVVYPWPRPSRDVFLEEIPRLSPGVTEIFLHPAAEGNELRGYDPAHADIRSHDAECLVDPAVARLLRDHDVITVSQRDLRALQRAG
jgi:predicted glycoside hydrolase/deacetylase ChbG (UPF0249 family)